MISGLGSQSKFQMFTLFSGRHVGVPWRYTSMAASYLPWSQRISFILSWQILRREPLLLLFFYWHKALKAEKKTASGQDR